MGDAVIDLTLSSDDEAAPPAPASKRARTSAAFEGDSDVEIVELPERSAAAASCAAFGALAPSGAAGGAAGDADADVMVTGVSGVVRGAAARSSRAVAGRAAKAA